MKALIISDSHGLKKELLDVIERHRDEVDVILHCGDSELDGAASELSDVNTVRGNCDIGTDFPEEYTESFQGFKVFVTHGHLYNVKMTYVPLSYRAEEVEAQMVCFGHSHVATSFQENGVIYVNPGSIRLPRARKEQTYCIAEVTDDKVQLLFYDRSGEFIPDLSAVYHR
ncbi:metallophosphoesterase family protein [Halalkalibacterium ligniniphilum]|uniref:metallophosphoesterase family protein n=1 Tax=Halalkalibacterium ligniniphilum TaxID=1134413 RepID=UPI000346E99F|nr:metallophosphoesterase [Halalkalibacterium ligniniphilum]